MLLLVALTPILVLLIGMVVFKQPAIKVFPPTLALMLGFALFPWQMPVMIMATALAKGLFLGIEILLIVVGALMLLETTTITGCLAHIKETIKNIHPDKRVQAILIAFCFGAFLEGISGFGSPAALAAPLMVGIGFPPLAAIVLALVANSTPVSFGALGTPVLICLSPLALSSAARKSTTTLSAVIQGIIGSFLPLLVACLTAKLVMNKPFKEGLQI